MKRLVPNTAFRKYLLMIAVLGVLGTSTTLGGTPNDGSPKSVLTIVVYAVLIISAAVLLYTFSFDIGMRAPWFFRHRKKTDKSGHVKEILSTWNSWKNPFYDELRESGVSKLDSYFWIEKLARMNFTYLEVRRQRDAIVKIASLGMTPDNFEHLYKLGINRESDFIRIAENDIDASIAITIFTTVTNDERRIMRVNEKQEVFEIA